MIITISGANFSASNIGTLSTWTVSKSIGAGAEHSIPSYVDKNSAFNYTITLKDGYTFGTYSVTMGGQTITPTVTETSMTINIASVTGAIRIEVKTINSSTGEEDKPVTPKPDQPGTGGSTPTGNLITLGTKQTNKKLGSGNSAPISGDGYDVYEDIPVSATSVYKFTKVYRSWWKTSEKSDIITFNPGTGTAVSPSNASYMSITTSSKENPYVELIYDASSNTRPSGQNIITTGTFNDNKALSAGSYSLTAKEGYYVYDKIPVTPGEIYKISGALRIWWLDSTQKGLTTENLNSVGGICVVPTNAAYISVTISSEMVPQSDAYMIRLS